MNSFKVDFMLICLNMTPSPERQFLPFSPTAFSSSTTVSLRPRSSWSSFALVSSSHTTRPIPKWWRRRRQLVHVVAPFLLLRPKNPNSVSQSNDRNWEHVRTYWYGFRGQLQLRRFRERREDHGRIKAWLRRSHFDYVMWGWRKSWEREKDRMEKREGQRRLYTTRINSHNGR